jgi:uncharacterized protein
MAHLRAQKKKIKQILKDSVSNTGEIIFRNTTNKKYTFDEMLEAISLQIRNNPYSKFRLYLGTDSQVYFQETSYFTAIILHDIGHSAIYFYTRKVRNHNNNIDLSVRLYNETSDTIEILKKIESSIIIDLIGKENISIDVDAGYDGESKKVIDACTGWVRSYGYECHFKPDSIASSRVADRFTK